MTECNEQCKATVYHMQNDCCRARWLAGCFVPHSLAMLDRWQQQDIKILGKNKAIERRKAVVKMAKTYVK